MAKNTPKNGHAILPRETFPQLFDALKKKGYRIVGPTVREGAIVYDELTEVAELPVGWSDVQLPGRAGLRKRSDAALFGYTVGPQSWKKFLLPPHITLWSGERNGLKTTTPPKEIPKLAFLGVRACEIKAILIQDEVMMKGPFADSDYSERRKNALIIAAQCTQAGGTCFCTSMGTGPHVTDDYDIVLTELLDDHGHRFVTQAGSKRGEEILKELPLKDAPESEVAAASALVTHTAQTMGRTLETAGLRDLLYRSTEHLQWDDVATRCMSCANCTLVCPTCFCTTVEDHTDLSGQKAERVRRWDSCFTVDFSYIHGGSIRSTVRSRYRQWMTHKLASWVDQFGTFGCVGCGRCITWCPVGIDITEEAAAIRNRDVKKEVTHGND
jgi:sulfhydrogenase subunit beta (sulfur reductase)